MKYADGLWLNKPGYGVNYATQMYEVTADETSINVLATNQWIGNRGMTLGGPVLEITFTSTLENTIKVSIDHYKGRVHKSPDFQLNEDKSFRPVIKETDGAYELISGNTKVVVAKGGAGTSSTTTTTSCSPRKAGAPRPTSPRISGRPTSAWQTMR